MVSMMVGAATEDQSQEEPYTFTPPVPAPTGGGVAYKFLGFGSRLGEGKGEGKQRCSNTPQDSPRGLRTTKFGSKKNLRWKRPKTKSLCFARASGLTQAARTYKNVLKRGTKAFQNRAQMAPRGAKMKPKWCQHGAKNLPKWRRSDGVPPSLGVKMAKK